jgi:hypothetical protein
MAVVWATHRPDDEGAKHLCNLGKLLPNYTAKQHIDVAVRIRKLTPFKSVCSYSVGISTRSPLRCSVEHLAIQPLSTLVSHPFSRWIHQSATWSRQNHRTDVSNAKHQSASIPVTRHFKRLANQTPRKRTGDCVSHSVRVTFSESLSQYMNRPVSTSNCHLLRRAITNRPASQSLSKSIGLKDWQAADI